MSFRGSIATEESSRMLKNIFAVILNEVKDLYLTEKTRFFAALRMTKWFFSSFSQLPISLAALRMTNPKRLLKLLYCFIGSLNILCFLILAQNSDYSDNFNKFPRFRAHLRLKVIKL
jgi:hypothetical protein